VKLLSSSALFVVPRGRGDGFQARVRGHVLDLVDPSFYALAPTADDLLIVSIASPLAWTARTFLRTRGLPDYVSVTAEWQTHDDVNLTVTVSRGAEVVSDELTAALEHTVESRSPFTPVLHISFEE